MLRSDTRTVPQAETCLELASHGFVVTATHRTVAAYETACWHSSSGLSLGVAEMVIEESAVIQA